MSSSHLVEKNCSIKVINLGLSDYLEVLNFQRNYLHNLIAGSEPEALIICEHPAVITHGRGANISNILRSATELKALQLQVLEVERGGDVTWHGPGQLIAYPLLDLRNRKQDVAWYLRKLEAIIIKFLAGFQISSERICNKTGVWVGDRKIASIGVKLSRWCSMHGLSINYLNCQSGFSTIRACGLPDLKVTSIIEEQPQVNPASLNFLKLSEDFARCFLNEFNNIDYDKKNQNYNHKNTKQN